MDTLDKVTPNAISWNYQLSGSDTIENYQGTVVRFYDTTNHDPVSINCGVFSNYLTITSAVLDSVGKLDTVSIVKKVKDLGSIYANYLEYGLAELYSYSFSGVDVSYKSPKFNRRPFIIDNNGIRFTNKISSNSIKVFDIQGREIKNISLDHNFKKYYDLSFLRPKRYVVKVDNYSELITIIR